MHALILPQTIWTVNHVNSGFTEPENLSWITILWSPALVIQSDNAVFKNQENEKKNRR